MKVMREEEEEAKKSVQVFFGVVFVIFLMVVGLALTFRHVAIRDKALQDACEQRGGVWLWHEHACVAGPQR